MAVPTAGRARMDPARMTASGSESADRLFFPPMLRSRVNPWPVVTVAFVRAPTKYSSFLIYSRHGDFSFPKVHEPGCACRTAALL